MRNDLAGMLLAVLIALLPMQKAGAGGRSGEGLHLATITGPNACTFYRGQAYGKGIAHFTTEMLWACEAIAERRAAEVPVGDRLMAVEAALEAYREAVIGEGQKEFARARSGGSPWLVGMSDEAKRALAERTGALLALEAIRTGF